MRSARRAAVVMFVLGVLRDLAIGCVVTFLVAWGIALLLVLPFHDPTAIPKDVTLAGADGTTTIKLYGADLPGRSGFSVLVVDGLPYSSAPDADVVRRPWLEPIREPSRTDLVAIQTVGLASGWPMLSLWYEEDPEIHFESGSRTLASRAPRLTLRAPFRSDPIELPMRPIWIGFAVDALIYACVIRAMFFGATWWRGRRRRKRGMCRRCGHPHDVATTCPECGHPVRAGAGASANSAPVA